MHRKLFFFGFIATALNNSAPSMSEPSLSPDPGSVVGTIHSPGALAAALNLPPGALDYLELRVDAFAPDPSLLERLERAAPRLGAPCVLTVRHPAEGGAGGLETGQRAALYRRWLPQARLVDLELRSARELAEIVRETRESGRALILSHHDFEATPTPNRLRELHGRAAQEGASVFKVATMTRTARDLATLLSFLVEGGESGGPAIAVMGMGSFGKLSRLTLGRSGSVLNYGYLDEVQVPGQWPAEELKRRLAELAPGAATL